MAGVESDQPPEISIRFYGLAIVLRVAATIRRVMRWLVVCGLAGVIGRSVAGVLAVGLFGVLPC